MASLRVVGVWLIGAVALTGGCALASNWLSGSSAPSNSADVQKLVNQFRAEGWPCTQEQMESKSRADELNAAYYLETACNDLTAIEAEDGQVLDKLYNNTDSPALTKLTAKDISTYDSVLRLAERASGCSFLDFKRDWSQGMSISLPEVGPEHLIGYLLVDRAFIEARAGDAAKSLHDLQTAARLAGLESQDACQITCDMAIDMGATVWSVAYQCASQLTSNPAGLKWFAGNLKSLHLNADLMPALRGQAYIDYYRAQMLPIVQASTMFDVQARQQFASEDLSQPYVESHLRVWTFIGEKLKQRSPGETQISALEHALDQCDAWPGDDGQAARDIDMVSKYEDEQQEEQELTSLVAMVQQNQTELLKERQTLKKLAERTRMAAPAGPQPNPRNPGIGLHYDFPGGPVPGGPGAGVARVSPAGVPGPIGSPPAIRGPE